MADETHTLQAEVLTPEGKVFEGELYQLSARTVVGEVGIRARHAPMLARLVPCELRLYESEQDFNKDSGGQRFAAAEGWLEIFANHARVLVGEAREIDSLDPGSLKEQLSDAESRIESSDQDSSARETAELDKARAEAFLGITER